MAEKKKTSGTDVTAEENAAVHATSEEGAVAPTPAQEKKVTIKIPRARKDEEDVVVFVNDRSWLIKRGVSVEVPECVAEVLRHQEEMLDVIFEFNTKHAE